MPHSITSIGDHIRKRRIGKGLLQSQVAKFIGVTEDCITYWENNKSTPTTKFYPKIIDFLGYNPAPLPITIGQKLKYFRNLQGLTTKQLAAILNIDATTIQSWEAETHRPSEKNLKTILEFIKAKASLSI